jgi:hypothetical protein
MNCCTVCLTVDQVLETFTMPSRLQQNLFGGQLVRRHVPSLHVKSYAARSFTRVVAMDLFVEHAK